MVSETHQIHTIFVKDTFHAPPSNWKTCLYPQNDGKCVFICISYDFNLCACILGASTTTRDLYCVLESDRIHKARTVVRSGDLVFDWDETFELDLFSNRELDFLVYSWDPQYRHKLCYKVCWLDFGF